MTVCGLLCAVSLSASGQSAVRLAASPPPAPTLYPSGGTGACPYDVTLSDSDPDSTIFYTLDGKQPTLDSARGGGRISIQESQTIKAIAANLTGASSVVTQNYVCGAYSSLTLTIGTGADDARDDSAIQAIARTGTGTTTWCLKPSNNGTFQSCARQEAGVAWEPLSAHTSQVTAVAPIPQFRFESLTIQLMQFPKGSEGDDNWDLQHFTLTGNVSNTSPNLPASATIWSVSGTTPPGPGNCYARFKHPAGPLSTVEFETRYIGGPLIPHPVPTIVLDRDGNHEAPYCKP